MHFTLATVLGHSTFLLLLASSNAVKYLKEKPSYLKPCRLEDPTFKSCLAGNLDATFHEWRQGVPGTKAIGPFDPFHVKRVKLVQDEQSRTLAINLELTNVEVKGISNVVTKDISYDPNTHKMRATVFMPKMEYTFDYKLVGHVLALPLNSQGKGHFETTKSLMAFELTLVPRPTPEAIFADVQRSKAFFTEIGTFQVHLDNLFGTTDELGQSANEIFNTNWREFYEILQPGIDEIYGNVLMERFKQIFNYVPINYYIENFQ